MPTMQPWPRWQKFFLFFAFASAVCFVAMICFVFAGWTDYDRKPCEGLANATEATGELPRVAAVWPRKADPKPLVLGAPICLKVSGLKAWLDSHAAEVDKLALFVSGQRVLGLTGVVLNPGKGLVQFSLARTAENAAAWSKLIAAPPMGDHPGELTWTVGVGPSTGSAFGQEDGVEVRFAVFRLLPLVLGLIALLFAVVSLAILAPNTSILRDGGVKSPFSLARCQMAFWLYLITASFIYIWLVTGDANGVLTAQALVLLGISGTTGLAAVAMDGAPPPPGARPDVVSGTGCKPLQYLKRFAKDLLSSQVNGIESIQLHRVQIVAWTLILGVVFVWEVYHSDTMPTFDSTLLIMMGISSGLYLGFKAKET